MRFSAFVITLGFCLVIGGVPAVAHHSFSAEFDSSKSITLEGTLTKLDWTNPHIWLYVDVGKEGGGEVAKWQCEGGPPNSLTRNGWSKDSVKPGDHVTIEGFLAKDGSRTCNLRSLKLPNGKSVFSGSNNEGYK